MENVFVYLRMGPNIMELGKIINNMDKSLKFGQIGRNFKEIIRMDKVWTWEV